MPESIDQLLAAEEEALGEMMAEWGPADDGRRNWDEFISDLAAYRTAVERRVRAEEEAKRAGLIAAHPWMGGAAS